MYFKTRDRGNTMIHSAELYARYYSAGTPEELTSIKSMAKKGFTLAAQQLAADEQPVIAAFQRRFFP